MKKWFMLSALAAVLAGCAGLKTQISFSNRDEIGKTVSGTVKGSLSKVQEFRSLLEALEYRVTEKVK